MYVLQRIYDEAVLAQWQAVPQSFAIAGTGLSVDGATVGWQAHGYRVIAQDDPVPDPPTKADLLAHAAAKRWQVETGGVVATIGGQPFQIPTDERTRGVLTAAWAKATADAEYVVIRWKVAPGVYLPLDAATILAMADAVESHVQDCFLANEAVDSKILDETYTTFSEIDAAAEWPSNT